MGGADALRGRYATTLSVAALTFAADQLTKHWAVNALDDEIIEVFWTLRLNLVFNEGVAFSVGDGSSLGPFVTVAALVVVTTVVVIGLRMPGRLAQVAVGLVAGGALGNLADRVFRAGDGFLGGRVVDFIDFQWWPVWNVADAGVVVGGLLLFVASWRAEV